MSRQSTILSNFVWATVVGIYSGRIFGEFFTPPFWLTLTIMIFITGLCWLTMQRWVWLNGSSLVLLGYILYPIPDPYLGLWFGLWWLLSQLAMHQMVRLNWQQGWLFVVPLGTFGLYFFTLASGVLPADSGEFQLVAAQLGLAHPPGFPLYTILSHLFTWLPLPFSAAYKVNLLSAVTSTLTVLVVYAAAHKLTQRHLPALIAAGTLASSTTFWAQATTANIRSLTTLFAALAFYALIQQAQRSNTTSPPNWIPFTLALSFGLTHHISLAFIALIMGLFVLLTDSTLIRTPNRWPPIVLATAAGLLPLIYLPWRDPTLRQFESFIGYALGLGFQGDFFYFNTAELLQQRLGVMLNILTFQFNELLLVGMAGGFLLLLWQRPRLAFLLGGSFAMHTFIVATYRAPQAVEYMMPAYIPLVLCLAYGLKITADLIHTTQHTTQLSGALLTALFATAAVNQATSHFPSYYHLSTNTYIADYTQNILANAPDEAIVLANWHWATPLWYLQQVEGQRPDLEIVYLFPQTADYNTEWVGRIQQELDIGHPVITTYFEEFSFATLPPPYPLAEAFLFTPTPLETLPADFTSLNLTLGDQLRIDGYQLSQNEVKVSNDLTVTLAWQFTTHAPPETRVAVHLVGFDGQIYAQQDLTLRPQEQGLTLTQFHLTPRLGAQPGDFGLRIIASQAGTLLPDAADNQTHIIETITVRPMAFPPYTINPTYRPLATNTNDNNEPRTLIGYDHDNTLPNTTRLYLHWQTPTGYWTQTVDLPPTTPYTLPETHTIFGRPTSSFTIHHLPFTIYTPLSHGLVYTGSTPPLSQSPIQNPKSKIPLTQTFHATRPVLHDIGISVRLIGFAEDGVTWAWRTPDTADSDIPAMGGIPTLKWIAGSTVYHPRVLEIDAAAYPDQQVGGLVRPYNVFTNRPLTILDERIVNQQPWLPLTPTTIR